MIIISKLTEIQLLQDKVKHLEYTVDLCRDIINKQHLTEQLLRDETNSLKEVVAMYKQFTKESINEKSTK